jgi:hypothetical protein
MTICERKNGGNGQCSVEERRKKRRTTTYAEDCSPRDDKCPSSEGLTTDEREAVSSVSREKKERSAWRKIDEGKENKDEQSHQRSRNQRPPDRSFTSSEHLQAVCTSGRSVKWRRRQRRRRRKRRTSDLFILLSVAATVGFEHCVVLAVSSLE